MPVSTSPSSPRSTRTASWRSPGCSSSIARKRSISSARPEPGRLISSLALGVEAVKAGRSVYFSSLADIVATLVKAERDGALRERIRYYCRFALLIVDEIGYLPVTPGGGNLFFQLVNARYEKGAMILTSNRGFAEWGDIFGDSVVATALLDRLLHHAVVIQIEGSSYRLREHADLLPEDRPLQAERPRKSHSADPEASRPAAKKRRRRSRPRLIAKTRQTGEFCGATFEENRGAIDRRFSPKCAPAIRLCAIWWERPKGRLTRLEKQLLDKPWRKAREGVEVKLLAQDDELYVFAQSADRVNKERAMRRRQLKWLWARLKKLADMDVSREERLMKLGAARSKAPSAWRLVKTEVDKRPAR